MIKTFFLFFCSLWAVNVCAQQTLLTDTATLEGKLSRKTLEAFRWFNKNHQAYQPKKSVIRKISKQREGVKMLIILGTWCSDSREHLPALMKVCDLAGITDIELIGVNRKKKSTGLDLSTYQIEYVPLIIVYVNGKEKGRIIESPKKSIEADLLNLLY